VPHFAYIGRNAQGARVEGVMESASGAILASHLAESGIIPIQISESAAADRGAGQAAGPSDGPAEGRLPRRAAVQPADAHPDEGRRADHARPGRTAGVGHEPRLRRRHQGSARGARFRPRAVAGPGPQSEGLRPVLCRDDPRRRDHRQAGGGLPQAVPPSRVPEVHEGPGQGGIALPDVRDAGDGHRPGDHQPLRHSGLRQGVQEPQHRAAADDAGF
jgi:hypothetical protein